MSWRGKGYMQLLCETIDKFTNNESMKGYPNEERKYNTELEIVNHFRDIDDEAWIMVKNPIWKEQMEQAAKEIQLTPGENIAINKSIKRRKRNKYPYWRNELRKRYNARRKRKHKKNNGKN